jgi:hypothetical protein
MIVVLIVAFLPTFVAMAGANPVWKFLAFLFSAFSLAGAIFLGGPLVGIASWVIAWIFAGVSYSTKGKQVPGASGLFSRRCPHCRKWISDRTTVCNHCGRDVPAARWIWEKPAPEPHHVAAGVERNYRGYTYAISMDGRADLKLPSGRWRRFSSVDELHAFLDART